LKGFSKHKNGVFLFGISFFRFRDIDVPGAFIFPEMFFIQYFSI